MKKITDIFQAKEKTYSFELFPPKTEPGRVNLLSTIKRLCALNPDFISCTYGAGGGNRDQTLDIVQNIQEEHGVTAMAHLTCVMNTKEQIAKILSDIKNRGINNILTLRGDPPLEYPDWKPSEDNFKYSSELCGFIRAQYADYFTLGVAGFPEGHILCPDKDRDAQYLKIKVENGADFVITQIFFDNNDYFEYVSRLEKLGVKNRIIPGILPITNYQGLLRFSDICGATVKDEIKNIFEPIQEDNEKTLSAGIDYAVRQCGDLLQGGAPGLHFFTLNKLHPTAEILAQVKG